MNNELNNRWGILYCPRNGIKSKRKRWERLQKELDERGVHYDMVQSHMLMGGIPYYLGYMKKGLSLAQNIDQLFCVIAPEGCIHLEYNNIFTVQEMDEKVTNLLPYDSLLSSIEHSFSDICTKMESEGETGIEYKVDAIVLGCCYQEDENGNHTLVPAWYLFNTNESYYGQLYPVVVINAIDGSLITEYFTGGEG